MIVFQGINGTTQVILGTTGEYEIQQALVARINNPTVSDSSRKECERLLEYCFGIFKDLKV